MKKHIITVNQTKSSMGRCIAAFNSVRSPHLGHELWELAPGEVCRYAVWLRNHSSGGKGNGVYLMTLDEALDCFEERVRREERI